MKTIVLLLAIVLLVQGKFVFRRAQSNNPDIQMNEQQATAAYASAKSLFQPIEAVLQQACASADVKANVLSTLKTMRVILGNNQFDPRFNALKDSLVAPVDLTAFIQRTAKCASTNFYYVEALRDISADSDVVKILKDGATGIYRKEICKAISLAVVLDRLGQAVRNDYTLLEWFHETSQKIREDDNYRLFGAPTLFGRVKHFSVDLPLDIIYNAMKDGPGWKLRAIPEALAANIMEAVASEGLQGYFDNPRAGTTLAFDSVRGQSDSDTATTGSAPAGLVGSGISKAYSYRPYFPKLWDDLYSTWNLAFTARYPEWPFFWAKLLNPFVGCYYSQPDEYIYRRAISLQHFIIYLFNYRMDAEVAELMEFEIPQMRTIFGAQNRLSAQEYAEKISNS